MASRATREAARIEEVECGTCQFSSVAILEVSPNQIHADDIGAAREGFRRVVSEIDTEGTPPEVADERIQILEKARVLEQEKLRVQVFLLNGERMVVCPLNPQYETTREGVKKIVCPKYDPVHIGYEQGEHKGKRPRIVHQPYCAVKYAV